MSITARPLTMIMLMLIMILTLILLLLLLLVLLMMILTTSDNTNGEHDSDDDNAIASSTGPKVWLGERPPLAPPALRRPRRPRRTRCRSSVGAHCRELPRFRAVQLLISSLSRDPSYSAPLQRRVPQTSYRTRLLYSSAHCPGRGHGHVFRT